MPFYALLESNVELTVMRSSRIRNLKCVSLKWFLM